ncbi:rapid alkalinization factor-like [Tasmannia lanceolata]|uniref:rapid alkalinization factor-like n=1 Tax=Tasmannia lanceolata TaxID=3420 RepID=UPI00406358DB
MPLLNEVDNQAYYHSTRGLYVFEPNSWKKSEMKVMVKRACNVNMGGECLWEEEMEIEMDSEINRRLLDSQKKYISYESLKKDEVPCSRPGASYYNCHGLSKANPYTRGCEFITGCARDPQP